MLKLIRDTGQTLDAVVELGNQVELLDPLKVDIRKVIDLSVDLPNSEYGYWSSSKQVDDWWP
ncbi:hypothetical protein ACF8LH_04250 [Pseudomonas sp. zbq_4]|uniref:hypothetical protein n=1 Tax=Pseudomonas sp. zbq_4 TaxID=3367240 RepID=UPI00370BE930